MSQQSHDIFEGSMKSTGAFGRDQDNIDSILLNLQAIHAASSTGLVRKGYDILIFDTNSCLFISSCCLFTNMIFDTVMDSSLLAVVCSP